MFVLCNTGVTFLSVSSDLVSESLGVHVIGSDPGKCLRGQVSWPAPGGQDQVTDKLCHFVLTEDFFLRAPTAEEESGHDSRSSVANSYNVTGRKHKESPTSKGFGLSSDRAGVISRPEEPDSSSISLFHGQKTEFMEMCV